MLLKEVPEEEKPREKLLNKGVNALSNTELLAIMLRTGAKGKSAIDLAQEVLYELNSIKDLDEITVEELEKSSGIGKTKAVTILASIELGKRIMQDKAKRNNFKDPKEVYVYFEPLIKNFKEERLYCLYLDVKGNLIANKLLTIGGLNETYIDPKAVLKWALKLSSSDFILVHNHPSGDSRPSLADIKVTKQIIEQAKLMDLNVLDHIIIGDNYFSMRKDLREYHLF